MFWLLAVSKIDESYNARLTNQDVRIALESLVSFYDREGQGYTIYLPLIGTGMSRAGLDNDDSYNMIKKH